MKMKLRGAEYDVELFDDGTLDTVLNVDSGVNRGTEHRYSQEYASGMRNDFGDLTPQGFSQLASEAIDEHIELQLDIIDRY